MKTRAVKVDLYFWLIFLIGAIVRLYSFFNSYVIGKDSPLYLYQAMVLLKGDFSLLDLCGFSSRIKEINLFSVVIIPFYLIFKDWEIAGKLVSFLSSSISLYLLYLILRPYFTNYPLYLTLLVYSFMPTLVKESSEVMRESFFTMLILLGVFLFLKSLQTKRIFQFLLFALSNLFFILSSWVRIEGIFLIFFTFIYLFLKIFLSENKKEFIKIFLSYSFLPIALGLSFLLYVSFYKSFLFIELKGKLSLLNPFAQPFVYTLKEFKYLNIPAPSPYFWDMVKQNLWLIAFGTTFFYKFIPAIYVSNLLFLIAGFKNLKDSLKNFSILWYFLILSIGYFIGLWYFTFTKWYMEKRYMLPLLFFLSPFIALGFINLRSYFSKLNISFQKVVILLVVYIILSSSITIYKPLRKELLEIKTIALDIAHHIDNQTLIECSKTACPNLIFTPDPRFLFYVSNYKKVPLCPRPEENVSYFNFQKLPNEQIINYILSKQYKFAILKEEVFKERTNFLKIQLENLGIKTYIVKKQKNP